MYYKIMNRAAETLNYVLMIMMPVGIIIMLTPELKEKYLWTTNIFILLQFLAMLAYMLLNFTGKSVLTAAGVMLVSGYLLELTGIKTDFPFGSYFYTETLQPQISGVPIAISISWVMVVAVSYLIVLRAKHLNLFATVVYSSALVLAFDFLLEPFASFINFYWKWTLSFVPLQNYVTWFLAAAVFTVFLKKVLVNNSNSVKQCRIVPFTPIILYMVSIIQFSVINIYHGYYIPTISGIVLTAVILTILYRRPNEV